MGQVKHEWMRMQPYEGLGEFIDDLILWDEIDPESAACGIAKLVADKGEEALSPAQEEVWQTYFFDRHASRSCTLCGGGLDWDELAACIGETPFCFGCRNILDRVD